MSVDTSTLYSTGTELLPMAYALDEFPIMFLVITVSIR